MASSLDDSRLQGHAERLVAGLKVGGNVGVGWMALVGAVAKMSARLAVLFVRNGGKKYYNLTERWQTYLHLVAICLMSKMAR